MDGGWVRRMRWRWRGAWLWPAFAAATIADAVIGHALPAQGDSQSLAATALAALVLNLLGVILLSRPVGMLIRRHRRDMPLLIARNYGGTVVVAAITAAFLTAGVAHHQAVVSNQRALRDAIVRAQAWIGDRAPPTFRRNVQFVDMFAIEPGRIYRVCVPNQDGSRTYCVIVDDQLPFASSVRFGGYEPNASFSEGVG
jgi:hypothetical protein